MTEQKLTIDTYLTQLSLFDEWMSVMEKENCTYADMTPRAFWWFSIWWEYCNEHPEVKDGF